MVKILNTTTQEIYLVSSWKQIQQSVAKGTIEGKLALLLEDGRTVRIRPVLLAGHERKGGNDAR